MANGQVRLRIGCSFIFYVIECSLLSHFLSVKQRNYNEDVSPSLLPITQNIAKLIELFILAFHLVTTFFGYLVLQVLLVASTSSGKFMSSYTTEILHYH